MVYCTLGRGSNDWRGDQGKSIHMTREPSSDRSGKETLFARELKKDMASATQPTPPPPAPQPTKSGRMVWILVAAMMAVEGAAVFFVAKMFAGAPTAADAANEDTHASGDAHHDMAESKDTGAAHGPAAKGDHAKSAQVHGAGNGPDMPADALAEVKLAECKTFNKETGKLVLFHIRVSVLVSAADGERAAKLVEARQARIDDRVNTVIRSAEPRHLNEPGLETLKRRLKFELDRMFGDPRLVQEVLIPYLVQTGSGL